MARRKTLTTFVLKHPTYDHTMHVQCMDDGNFDFVILNPDAGRLPMRWALARLFTGGKTGSRFTMMRVDELRDADEYPGEDDE